MKLARFIQRNPEGELPEVPLVSEKEEKMRSLVSMEQFLMKNRIAAINRLHALFAQAGIVDVTKRDLKGVIGFGILPDCWSGACDG